MSVLFDERSVRYEWSSMDELEPAYACSIHKSQGSEFPGVVIALHTQHYLLLKRNLLYTAVTRGRRLAVDLVGSRKALAIAVKNTGSSQRCTRLAVRLRQAAGTPGDNRQARLSGRGPSPGGARPGGVRRFADCPCGRCAGKNSQGHRGLGTGDHPSGSSRHSPHLGGK